MQLESVEISNFRSIRHLEARLRGPVVPVCGANGAGKSNFLRAIRFALLSDFSSDKMPANINNQLTSSNAAVKVSLRFSKPLKKIAREFKLKPKTAFQFTVSVKRNGRARAYLNGEELTQDQRKRFVSYFYLINVPPVRDIEADGLRPLRRILLESLRRTKGPSSFQQKLSRLTAYISTRGDALLENAHAYLNDWSAIEGFSVDVESIDFSSPLENTKFHAKVDGQHIPIDKLGTGYQSSLVIQSYIQLASGVDDFVLFFFEEPDNHLHPASMKAMADELKACASEHRSQVFFTTHSPHLINQFDFGQAIAVRNEGPTQGSRVLVNKDNLGARAVQITLTKHGMLPAEALLARRVVITEGALDVQIVNKMVELEFGISPDRQDILVVSGGGKVGAKELFVLLKKMGVDALVVFDWDALRNDQIPYFNGAKISDSSDYATAVDLLAGAVFTPSNSKPPKHLKVLRAMRRELNEPVEHSPGYEGSVVDQALSELSELGLPDITDLASYALNHQVDNVRRCLGSFGIWVWKVDPEYPFVKNDETVDTIIQLLLRRNFIAGAPTVNRAAFLRNWIKKLASNAKTFDHFFDSVWDESLFNHTEYRKLAKAVCG